MSKVDKIEHCKQKLLCSETKLRMTVNRKPSRFRKCICCIWNIRRSKSARYSFTFLYTYRGKSCLSLSIVLNNNMATCGNWHVLCTMWTVCQLYSIVQELLHLNFSHLCKEIHCAWCHLTSSAGLRGTLILFLLIFSVNPWNKLISEFLFSLLSLAL